MEENRQKQSLLSRLRDLEVGQKAAFPVARLSYVRASCASFGAEWGRKFRTSLRREDGEVDVYRES